MVRNRVKVIKDCDEGKESSLRGKLDERYRARLDSTRCCLDRRMYKTSRHSFKRTKKTESLLCSKMIEE